MLQYPLLAGDYKTRVLEDGLASDKHIVFVHGITSRADRWRSTMRTLAAAGYHTVAFDLPGHGFATNGGEIPYSVPFFARFVLEAMTCLGIQRANLVGTSLGGQVVAEATCRDAERVESAVMVGSTGLVPTPGVAERISTRLLGGKEIPDDVRTRLRRMFADSDLVTDELISEEWRFARGPGAHETMRALGRYMRDQVEKDLVGTRLNAVPADVRMLLIWGADDKSVPLAVGERAAAAITRCRLVAIPEAGHYPYVERTQEFATVLHSFLVSTTA